MAGIKPRSCKAKGRVFQQQIRDRFREVGARYGLVDDDLTCTIMSEPGLDLKLSPKAKEVLGTLQIEMKKVEKLNVMSTFIAHKEKYKDVPGTKLLIHTRNSNAKKKTPVLVTMELDDYLLMLESDLDYLYNHK